MRITNVLLVGLALSVVPCELFAASAPPAPGVPSMAPIGGPRARSVVGIGPKDSVGGARTISGKASVVVYAPREIQPKLIEVVADGKSIGIREARPYTFEYDTTTVSDGEHVVKAIARDADAKEVWSASAKVKVANTRPAAPGSPGAPPVPPAMTPPSPRTGEAAQRPAKPRTPKAPGAGIPGGGLAPPAPMVPDRTFNTPPAPAAPSAPVAGLGQTYTNSDYGFAIQYPEGWSFRDKTVQMKPRTPGSFWIALGKYPMEKTPLVVNVRRTKLEPGTDAEKYATYNSYVQKWERKSVLGSTAFATVTREGSPKRFIHRMIIIKDGYAWMLNCTDASGKPAEESAKLFESMVSSLRITEPAQVPVRPEPTKGMPPPGS